MGPLGYLPLSLPFFSILVVAFAVLVAFVEIRALRYAYLRLGVSPRVAVFLLLISLFGSTSIFRLIGCRNGRSFPTR